MKCLLSGVPRIMYEPHPFRSCHSADKVNMLFEYTTRCGTST